MFLIGSVLRTSKNFNQIDLKRTNDIVKGIINITLDRHIRENGNKILINHARLPRQRNMLRRVVHAGKVVELL